MNGLDYLLQEIGQMARDEADWIVGRAQVEIEKIEAENLGCIEAQTREIVAKAEAEAANILARGASHRAIRRRNQILARKQALIEDAIGKATERIADLPDGEYFALLKHWAGQADVARPTVVHLNERDLARDSGDFLEGFPKAADVTLAREPAEISGGFLAVCGGMTVNCSLDAVFETYNDAIHRALRRILFDEGRGNEKSILLRGDTHPHP